MEERYAVTSHRTILLVDDTPNNLKLLARMLEVHGYDVRTVTSGQSALKSVRLEAPDLILLDIAMPDMDGYEVCERLQADPETRDIPVIFISALNDAMDKVPAFEVGGVDYISKPFQVQEVLARVRTHLALRTAQQQLVQQNRQLQQEVAERQRAEEQLQFLSRRLVDVQEQERRMLARELHDEVGQILTGLHLSLEVLDHIAEEQRAAHMQHTQQLVIELIQHVRKLSMHLRPPMLDDLGVLPALFWYFDHYTDQTHIQVRFQHSGMEQRLLADIEVTIYRIIQEALANIARYADVEEATVRLQLHHAHVTVHVEDHGRGFDPAAARATSSASGLASIRERVRLLGGQMMIEAAPGQGARIIVELPLAAASENAPEQNQP